MAVNESRSCNLDLLMGAKDGRYKTLTPSRGGEVEVSSPTIRSHELQLQYNIVDEAEVAELPQPQYGRRR